MAELSQALASLQVSSLPVVQSESPTSVLQKQGEEELVSSDSCVATSESLAPARADDIAAAMSSTPVVHSDPVNLRSLPASSLPVTKGEQKQAIDRNFLEDVGKSLPQHESAAPSLRPQLTREQLGKILGVSRETIRIWEKSGKLAQLEWSRVPGTGSNPKNPRLYRLMSTSATK